MYIYVLYVHGVSFVWCSSGRRDFVLESVTGPMSMLFCLFW